MRKGITGAGTLIVCAAVGWSAAGCEDSTSGAPSVAARVVGETNSDPAPRGAPGITALTWNVYLGADIGRVLAARTAEEAVVLATEEWGHVQATDFPARAGALARAIAAQRPHILTWNAFGPTPCRYDAERAHHETNSIGCGRG